MTLLRMYVNLTTPLLALSTIEESGELVNGEDASA